MTRTMLGCSAVPLRLTLALALLAPACATTTAEGPGPQQASFPSGQRVARSGPLALELSEARYDLRRVSLQVSLTNRGDAPLHLDRQGILLAYGELEFPVSAELDPPLPERTTVAPGASVALELAFPIEQAMVEAGTLHLMAVQRGDAPGDDGWLNPLRLVVPPPAAFVDAAKAAAQAGSQE